jgi:triacylglycerol lipase
MKTSIKILLGIISFILLIIIIKLILNFLTFKDAFDYVILNNLYCGKKHCKTPIIDLDYPTNLGTNYDNKIARYCADLIVRVEHGIKHNIPIPKKMKQIGLLYDKHDSPVFGVVWYNGNTAWIVYRGTYNHYEWNKDFDYKQRILPKNRNKNNQIKLFLPNTNINPYIHEGFLKIYNKSRKNLLKYINIIKPKKIIVTGHSLGAAISTICGIDLKLTGYDTIVYNFASPRVGDKALADLVQQIKLPLFRIVNESDIVPTLPSAVDPNFVHTHKPYFYNNCGKNITFNINAKSITHNHLMNVYISALNILR